MDAYLNESVRYLAAQSWQIAVLTVAVAAVTLALRHRSAHVRYLLWLIVLAKCLVPPLYMVPLRILPPATPSGVSDALLQPDRTAGRSGASIPTSPEKSAVQVQASTPPVQYLQPEERRLSVSGWLGITWLTGASAYLAMNLLRASRGHHWLRKSRKPLPDDRQVDTTDMLTSYGIRRLPRIWIVEGVGQPFVWGLLRGSIYVPPGFLGIESSEHRRDVLAHELSHIVRFDAAVNFLQVIAQAIFWFHPFVWWVNRRIRVEREKCCDETAVARLHTPAKEYCSAVVETLANAKKSTRPVPSLAVAGQVKNIEERIRTMLRPGREFYKHPSFPVAAVVVLLSLLAVPTTVVLTARAANQPGTDSAAADLIFENPTNLGPLVNSPDEDWSSSISADELELYFNSDRPGGLGQTDFWVATRKTKADPWGKPVNLGPTVNSPARETGICISADGLSLYFSSDRPGGYGGLDLWVTTRESKTAPWSAPVNLGPTVNSAADEHSPSLSTDGLELYFSGLPSQPESARPGGSGESDLWVTKRKTTHDPWGPPVNLGPTVNSPVADGNPSISGDGLSLYFNSDRPGGSVGRAIWVTRRKSTGDAWGTPVKLGLAVNTGFEGGPDITKDGSTLYFHSRRPGRVGGADIWQATLTKSTPESRQAAQLATSLHEAVQGQDIEQVGALLAKGANANAKDGGGRTPLHLAILYGNLDIVRFLVDHGAKLDTKDQDGWTAFRYAAIMGKRDLVEFLASKDVGLPALHVAVSVGDLARVKALVEQGANVDGKDELGWTPLFWATYLDRIDAAKLLIAQGASVQVRANDGTTPLAGWTMLHFAAMRGRQEITEFLIAKGADVNAKTSRGQTPLDIALLQNQPILVKMLGARGAEVSSVALAARMGDLARVKSLLAQGADINAQDGGRTALHYAAQRGFKEIVELLLAKGADVNAGGFGSENKSAADFAMENNQIEIVELLFSKGADISALHVALQRKDRAKAKELIENGADVKKRSPWGMTALHLAVGAGFTDVAELLIAKGADVNAKLNWTWTPLHRAAEQGHNEMVELLIAKGADVNATDSDGRTPLSYAKEKAHSSIVDLLQKHGAKE